MPEIEFGLKSLVPFPGENAHFQQAGFPGAAVVLALCLALLLASAFSAGSGQDEAPTNRSNTQRTDSGHLVSLITITRQQKPCNRNTQGSFPLSDSVRE